MPEFPISYKITITGAADARRQLAALQAEFGNDEGLKRFNRGIKEGVGNELAIGRAISYTNRSFRVQHQSLYEAGKAFRILGSAMRSAMSIMNTLSLLTIAQSTQTTGIKQSMADVAVDILEIERELTNLEKHGKKNTVEYQIKVQELANAKQKLKDFDTELKNVANNEFWGKITTVGFAITEGITAAITALNNPTISKHIFSAASKIGTLFGGVFTGFSTSIMKTGTWLSTALGVPAISNAAITSGTKTGGLFGASFLAGAAGAVTGVALGTILFDPIDKWLKDNMPGYKGFAEERDKTSQQNADFIFGKDSETKKTLQTNTPGWFGPSGNDGGKSQLEGISDWFKNIWNIPNSYEEMGGAMQGPQQVTGPMGNLVNTFGSKPIPVKITDISRPIFKDLGTGTSGSITASGGMLEQVETTIDNTDVIIEETKILKDEAKEAKRRASDNARMHHEAEMTALAAKQAMFEQTEATNALRLQMFQQQTLALQMGGLTGTNYGSSSGGGFGPSQGYGSSPSGYLGSNGKWYSDDEEAAKNGAAARGFNGIIDSPTNMLMGENGPEHVQITPMRYGGGGGGSVIINNYISGSVISEKELQKLSMDALKSGLKRVGF